MTLVRLLLVFKLRSKLVRPTLKKFRTSRSGLKEKNGVWYANDEGVVVIDLNNLVKD